MCSARSNLLNVIGTLLRNRFRFGDVKLPQEVKFAWRPVASMMIVVLTYQPGMVRIA